MEKAIFWPSGEGLRLRAPEKVRGARVGTVRKRWASAVVTNSGSTVRSFCQEVKPSCLISI